MPWRPGTTCVSRVARTISCSACTRMRPLPPSVTRFLRNPPQKRTLVAPCSRWTSFWTPSTAPCRNATRRCWGSRSKHTCNVGSLMLDIRFIREHPDLVQAGARKKRIDIDIHHLLELDERRRSLISRVESLKAQRNKMSKEMPTLQGAARQEAITQMRQVAEESRALESPLREVEAAFEALMLRVPNVPADDVPEGLTDADNVVIKTWGEIPRFDFPLRDHVELGEHLDIIDIPRGVKLAGSRTYFLKNAGALLEQAVLQFALYHMVRKGFTPMVVPHLVNDEAMVGTAYLP